MKKYAHLLLRVALALVFLWFGLNQIFNQALFIGYLPDWAMGHSPDSEHHHMMEVIHYIPNRTQTLLYLNGTFEVIFGLLLLLGFFTRFTSLLLSIHLFFIMFSLGYNDVAVRDFGLSLATFSIFLHGPGEYSLDKKYKKKLTKNKFFRFLYFEFN